MKIPDSGKRKALLVIDLQEDFIKPFNQRIVNNTLELLENTDYDLYVEVVFSAEEDSLWNRQQKWFCPKSDRTKTVDSIEKILKTKPLVSMIKHTRSIFLGNKNLLKILQDNSIEEIHLVGTETHDCILASAFSSFDNGFPTYVIEECCESGTPGRHAQGLEILRQQNMTNNSCLADTKKI